MPMGLGLSAASPCREILKTGMEPSQGTHIQDTHMVKETDCLMFRTAFMIAVSPVLILFHSDIPNCWGELFVQENYWAVCSARSRRSTGRARMMTLLSGKEEELFAVYQG